jgi:catechol 2,3-dioxygenase-like lactoylglutathione lyase family enzyme
MSLEKPTLMQLSVLVRDMKATVEFYRRLGLDIPGSGDVWDDHHRTVAAGAAGLELEFDSTQFAQKWAGTGDPGVVLGFSLPSREAVDERYADLIGAGYSGRRPPYDAFWGARYAIVDDPDGNAVGLTSPLDPTRRSRAPSL